MISHLDEQRQFIYFTMTVYWLKLYPSESVMEGVFHFDAKTIRGWVEYYCQVLELYCDEAIQLPQAWGYETFIGVVDGTHCRCYKPKHPELRWTGLRGHDLNGWPTSLDSRSISCWNK